MDTLSFVPILMISIRNMDAIIHSIAEICMLNIDGNKHQMSF